MALLNGAINILEFVLLNRSRVRFSNYLTILVTRANRFGSMLTPICFAVLRLTTSSTFIGCSARRSAGLANWRRDFSVTQNSSA